MSGFDRIEALLDQDQLVGIDFVEVDRDRSHLRVHFHRRREAASTKPSWIPTGIGPAETEHPVPVRPKARPGDLLAGLSADQIEILSLEQAPGSDLGRLRVEPPEWSTDRRILELTSVGPGGFGEYRLFIDHPAVDAFFNGVRFSFRGDCEAGLDCRAPPHTCPDEPEVDVPVDYQARDFWSLRRALLDFAAHRYPHWQDRLEADAGILLVEAISALGDELAYYQDRIGREAYLETASQRRSVCHHARLVDYEPFEGQAASTWLDLTVGPGEVIVPAGVDVRARSDNGAEVWFETGRGLADILSNAQWMLDGAIDGLSPHPWDEEATCLPVGATELTVGGWWPGLRFNDTTAADDQCRWVLLRTDPASGIRARRWPVCLVGIEQTTDPLAPPGHQEITRLTWQPAQALPFELDLTCLEVRCNLVPATAGRTLGLDPLVLFSVGADVGDLFPGLTDSERAGIGRSLERVGSDGSVLHRFTLPGSDETPLCWLGGRAEVYLEEVTWDGDDWVAVPDGDWQWQSTLLGRWAAQADDPHYCLEDSSWRRLVGYRRPDGDLIHRDYAGDRGKTLRFGDGRIGRIPGPGVFRVVYRLGNGTAGNLAADSLVHLGPGKPAGVVAVTNPLEVGDGRDPEPLDQIRTLAPEAFRALTWRAVRKEDYREAAERLDWVQRADASLRWTGSWTTCFVTADPEGAQSLSPERRRALGDWIERFRQAGRPALVIAPVYADIDLEIRLCVESHAYPGQVIEAVAERLLGTAKDPGFFSPDRFSFGDPLWRSRLEAAVQSVPGVRALGAIDVRRRGWFDWQPLPAMLKVGDHEVLRLENDPDHPERGTLGLFLEGAT